MCHTSMMRLQTWTPLEGAPQVSGNRSIFREAECNSQNLGKLLIVIKNSIVLKKYKNSGTLQLKPYRRP